ncbi:MAG: hypothetical protein HYW05_04775 [Candidatus Diapherotrites archaeon]|nr:hypothetical protein [Candidatus Diapherotrites archaeon]
MKLGRKSAHTKLGGTGVGFIKEKSLHYKHDPLYTRKFVAYSPEFAEFARKNGRALMKAVNLIRNNLTELEEGGKVADRKSGIYIQKAVTRIYRGRSWFPPLAVRIGGKAFFVKWFAKDLKHMADNLNAVERYLKEKNYAIKGFDVRILRPHLLYKGPGGNLLATDFYNRNEVKSYTLRLGERSILLPLPRARKIEAAITELVSGLKRRGVSIYEDEEKWNVPFSVNAFYQPKTKTILLYDIE